MTTHGEFLKHDLYVALTDATEKHPAYLSIEAFDNFGEGTEIVLDVDEVAILIGWLRSRGIA